MAYVQDRVNAYLMRLWSSLVRIIVGINSHLDVHTIYQC
jgi:hypothetical protein